MAQGVQLPDGSAVAIRPGETPQAAYNRAKQMYPESFAEKAPEEGPKSGFMPALKAGFSGLKSSGAALAGRAGLMGLPEAEKYIAEQEAYQKKTFAPTQEGFLESPLANIKELAGGSLPYIAAPLLAGAAAPAAAALGAGTGLATAAGIGASALASAGQFTGSNLLRQTDTGKKLGETDLGAAALAAIPQAALDTVSMRMIPGLGKMFESAGVNLTAKAANDLAKEGIKKTAADYLLATGKTMSVEGLTEASQQVFERMQAGLAINDPSARAEYFDNFIGGAVLGGILAPAGRYVERGQEQARFDKGERAKQVEARTAASQAAEQAAAAEQAQKQTPEYAVKAQQAYMAAEQRKTELDAQMHRAGKGVKLSEDQKQDNRETQQALKEHADVLKETNANYRASRRFLPPEPTPAPAPIEDTTQLQQPGMFGAAAAPEAPELDMFGQPVERTVPEAAAEPQADPRQQVRMLEQLVEKYALQLENASPEETVEVGPRAQQALKALADARKAVEALPQPVETQLAKLHQKLGVAKSKGDIPAQIKLAQSILDLQKQAVPSTQQGMEMQPFKSTVTGDRQLAVRPRAPNVNLGVEEQEADIAAQQAQAEQAYQALGKDRERQVQLYPETSALGRMAERNLPGATNINEQLGLFGPNDQTGRPSTPSSAPLGQMKQLLTGEDVTATAPETAPARPQRGGPAPFNLYPRREGTGAPVTADEIRERIYALQNRDDLTDEARAFLQRAEKNAGDKDVSLTSERVPLAYRDAKGNPVGVQITKDKEGNPVELKVTRTSPTFGVETKTEPASNLSKYTLAPDSTASVEVKNPSLFSMLDEQLGKIERNEEGVTNEGRGKPTDFRGFPVQTPATSTTAPTVAAGKDFEARSTAAAKALAAARRTKYEAGISAGLSPAEAARRASLVKQEDVAGPFAGRETEAAAPAGEVGVQKRGDAAEASTLRAPSTKGKPLSYPDALEQHLRVQEGLKQENEGQMSLFKGEALEPTAITKATPGAFRRYLNSKPVQEMREREAEAKQQAEELQDAQKVQRSIKELETEVIEIEERYQEAAAAKSILKGNAEIEAVIAKYGKLQSDPMFMSVLQLTASSRSQEHAALVDNIAVFTKAADDLQKQIATTQKAIGKTAKQTGAVSEALRENRVKIDILQKQQNKLNDTLTKLEALKANVDSSEAAKNHIESMLAVVAAQKALASMGGKAYSAFDLTNARVALTQALDAKRAAEAASKAQDTLRDTRDRSYNTHRKAEEMSAARTRAWNQLASLPSTRYRARTAAEERAFVTAAPGEVSKALAYERHLAGMAVLPLKMELGRLEQQARVLEKQIQTAKAKSESFLTPADNTAVSLPSPSGPFSPLGSRNYPAATGEKLVMYGPKGSVFTKPAFIGVEGYLQKQADLMVKIDALEKELGVKEASANPLETRKGESVQRLETMLADARSAKEPNEKQIASLEVRLAAAEKEKAAEPERAIAPATDEEADLIGMTEEKVAARAAAKERVAELEAALKSSQEEGNKKLVTAFAKDLVQARKELAEAEFAEKRRKQLVKRQTSEPSKLMTGSAESKATPGYTRQRLEEAKVEKLPTATAAVEAGNKMAAEKLLASKKLTKKEIAAMSLAQQDALQKAAFDRLLYVREQVSGAQQVVNNLLQVQADYKAGRRATFNVDTLTNAKKRLADFTAELGRASKQAGVLEDVGKMSKDELKEAATQAAAETKKGKSAKDIAAQATETAVSDVYAAPSKFYAARTTTALSEQAVEMAQEGRILDLAAELAKNGSTPDIRAAAAKLQPLLLRTKFSVNEGLTYKGESVAGLYDPQNNAITMHPEGLTEEDVLHELGHAATDYVLLADPATLKADQRAARKELEALHARITKSDLFKGEQGIDSVREFAAEVISNKDFRSKMDSVGKPTTLLQQVLGFIKRMLGMQTTMSGKEAQALVDRILAPSRKLVAKAAPSKTSEPFGLEPPQNDAETARLDASLKKWGDDRDAQAGIIAATLASGAHIENELRAIVYTYLTQGTAAGRKAAQAAFTDPDSGFALMDLSKDDLQTFQNEVHAFVSARMAALTAPSATNTAPSVFRKGVEYKSEDDLSKLAERAVAQPKTLRERAGSNVALQLEMQVADMRAGVIKALNNAAEDPNTMGSTREFRQAVFSITAADQHGAITQMALNDGPPTMFKDSKGYYEVRSSMKNDAGAIFDAVQDIPDSYGDAEAKMGLASAYMIAQRALNKGLKKLDLGALGIETEQELVDAMAVANADPKLKAALENARTKYNAYNRGMIEWLSSPQVAAITQADAKAYLKDEDYVPYYRVRADGVAELVFGGEKTITIGDISHQPYLAELKGGETKIMPLDKSIMRNTMLLVTKGMNNMAMKNVGYAMQAAGQGLGPVDKAGKPTNLMPVRYGKGPADASVIRWTQEPDPNKPDDKGDRYLRVQTTDTIFGGVPAELIIKSLEGAHLTLPGFLKWGGIAGDLLRAGVTRTPIYLARQLFRDPFAATATSGLDYGPITAIFKANREFLKITAGKSETGAKLIEKGLMQSGMFEGDPANMSKMALQLASGKSQGVLDKLFAKADKWALQADAATRALIYENAIKNGLSEVEASHSVRESMNFNKRGLNATVQYASRMIPFFNAQIQGLSVLFKAATGNMPANDVLKIKRKFFNNAMMLTGFGIAYAMAMDDDDYYKNATPRDRYTNFFVPLPGVDEPLKLPIPYEFGFFFSAGVALSDAIKGEVDTPQQLRAIKDMFVGSIPGASSNFMPQIVKPVAEVYANKSFFSGNALESERLRNLDPEARYKENTTEFAKWMATMAPGLSPIQLEHIVSGYLGQIPLMVLATTNDLFRDGKEAPTRKLSEMPLIGSSFQRKYGGEEADVVYKLAAEAVQAKRTFDDYRKKGNVEDAKEYLSEHRAEITVAPIALQYQKVMGALRSQEEIIRNSSATPDAKAKRIEALDAQRQLQSERYLKAIRRAQEASGKT